MDSQAAKLIVQMTGHKAAVLSLAFSPDRGLIASGSQDGTGRVWKNSSSDSRERNLLRQQGDIFPSIAFFPNSRTVAAGSGAVNGLVWLFDVTERNKTKELMVLRGARGSIDALTVSSDSKLVAAGGEDRTVRVWEPGSNPLCEARTLLTGHTDRISGVAFSGDSQGLATASRDRTVRVWALSRIRSSERLVLPHESDILSIAYATDGRSLATTSQNGAVRFWDLMALKPTVRMELTGHKEPIRLLQFASESPIVVGVGTTRVFNWDLAGGRLLASWEAPGAPWSAVALTRDGRYLGTGSKDGAVAVYRVAEKRK